MRTQLARVRAACDRWLRAAGSLVEKAGRRRVAVVAAVLLGAAAAAIAVRPIAAQRARATAARYGIELTVEDVDLGWGRLWLKGVELRLPEVPALRARLDAVAVGFGPTLAVKRVEVYGGQLRLSGPASKVRAQLARWRQRLPRGSGGSGHGGRRYIARGIDLSFSDRESSAVVWGASYERAEHETVGAERVRATTPRVVLEARRPLAVLGRRGADRVIERLALADLHADVMLDGPSTGSASAKPSAAAEESGPRGERLRRALALLAQSLDSAVAAGGRLELPGIHLRLRNGSQTLNIGPARLELRRQDPIFDVKFVAGGRETPMELDLRLPLGAGPVAIDLAGGPVSLAALGIQEGDFGLRRIDRAELQAKTTARLSADGKTLAIGASGRVSRLSLFQPKLSPDPLENIELTWRASGEAALDGSRIRLDLGELGLARTRIELKGELSNEGDRLALELSGGIPLASCQDMLDSAPVGLAPMLAGMQMTGTFSLAGKLHFDSLHPRDVESRIQFVNGCRIVAVPAPISPQRFASTFAYEAKDENGQSVRIYTGPDTAGWTRYDRISRFMEVALLVNEDGRFFHHRGFDQEAISNSLKENIKARRFVRGASTISMQLAKNLYLGRQKTLSRKLQEAVLTMLLEQELTKQEILELYLNVIEFGPGIYGIGAAAEYYFDTTPAQLSLAQAFHLASILPNPKHSHFGKDGNVSPRWSEYLRKLMQIARKRDLITDAELEAGLAEQVAFGVSRGTPPSAPDDDGYDEALFVPAGP